jgi:hypothetical protein
MGLMSVLVVLGAALCVTVCLAGGLGITWLLLHPSAPATTPEAKPVAEAPTVEKLLPQDQQKPAPTEKSPQNSQKPSSSKPVTAPTQDEPLTLLKPAPRRTEDAHAISPDQFVNLQTMIKPRAGEAPWEEISWMTNLWEARTKAAAEGKPLFVWSASADVLGCT